MMNQGLNIGEQFNLKINKLGINGEGIGYKDRLAIFVDGALPNEEVLIEISEIFENRAVAALKEIVKPSPFRRTPFCPIYELCGGCQTQHMDYIKTLDDKRDLIIQAFQRYLPKKVSSKLVKSTIGSNKPLNYRNKASLPIQKIEGKNRFGMYQKNSNAFIPIESCPIQDELINQIMISAVALMDELGIDGIDPKTKKGYVKSLVVRVNDIHSEAQVSIILNQKSNRLQDFVNKLIKKETSVKSVISVLHTNRHKIGFFEGDVTVLYGKDTIETKLGGYSFDLKPEAFFQLNALQADIFYQEMVRLADLKGREVAIDAYAGIAPVSHYIHQSVKTVYAIEIDPASCASARLSLAKNHISNVKILQSDFKRALSGLKEKKIDVMFFDPPRTGLGDDTIDLIKGFKPKKLIYGSCNPSTLAKDIAKLMDLYELKETVPIDMFPYTSLVESVTLLTLKKV